MITLRRLPLVLFGAGLVLACGCGARPDRWPPAGAPGLPLASTEHGGTHVVALVPLGDVQAPLMVDTGIRVNLLSSMLAWYFSLPRERTDLHLTDAASAEVPLLRLSAGLTLPRFGRLPAYAAFLPRSDAVGIWGMLSPQSLVSAKEAVVLDLARGELRRIPAEEATPVDAPLSAEACVSSAGTWYLVTAEVGGERARLLVDTGTSTTSIDAASPLGRALEASRIPHKDASDLALAQHDHPLPTVVTGGVVSEERVKVVRGVAVRTGSVSRTLDVQLSRQTDDGTCRTVGTLGLDFLRGFTLVLTRQALFGRPGADRLAKLVDPAPLPGVELTGIDVEGSCPEAAPTPVAEAKPIRYSDVRSGWHQASAHVREVAEAIAAACQRAGYDRAEIGFDLAIAKDRRTMRGKVTVSSGPRRGTNPAP